jgi:hypothetical protein
MGSRAERRARAQARIDMGIAPTEAMLLDLRTRHEREFVGAMHNALSSKDVAIPIQGGEYAGKMATSELLLPQLDSIQKPEHPVASYKFREDLPHVAKALILPNAVVRRGERYAAGIGGYDLQNALPIASQIAKEEPVVFRVVQGGSEEVSFRSLSYLYEPLKVMEKIQERGLRSPQLQVVIAQNITTDLNQLDKQTVVEQTKRFVGASRLAVKEFFPDLERHVVYLQDVSHGSTKDAFRAEVDRLAYDVKQYAEPVTYGRLMGKGNGNGADGVNRKYGGAHLIIHDTDISGILVPIDTDQPEQQKAAAIVSFGGIMQEGLYYDLRFQLKPHQGVLYNAVPTLQLFTDHHVPPYYMADGGDISLDDVIAGKEIDKEQLAKSVAPDINYFLHTSTYRGDVSAFLRRLQGEAA